METRVQVRIIEGMYKVDNNFTTVFSDNDKRIYTIPNNDKDNWASIRVGDYNYMGFQLTQNDYNRLKSECTKRGHFILNNVEG